MGWALDEEEDTQKQGRCCTCKRMTPYKMGGQKGKSIWGECDSVKTGVCKDEMFWQEQEETHLSRQPSCQTSWNRHQNIYINLSLWQRYWKTIPIVTSLISLSKIFLVENNNWTQQTVTVKHPSTWILHQGLSTEYLVTSIKLLRYFFSAFKTRIARQMERCFTNSQVIVTSRNHMDEQQKGKQNRNQLLVVSHKDQVL